MQVSAQRGHLLIDKVLALAKHSPLKVVRQLAFVISDGPLLALDGLLVLAENRQEDREQDEDGEEEVHHEDDDVDVGVGGHQDGVDVEVAEERAHQREDGEEEGGVAAHVGPELHVEHLREGGDGPHEDEHEEEQVRQRVREDRGGERKLGDEDVDELDDLDPLDHGEDAEVELGGGVNREDKPRVDVADLLADGRARRVFERLACHVEPAVQHGVQDKVGPVHQVPHVGKVAASKHIELVHLCAYEVDAQDKRDHLDPHKPVGVEDIFARLDVVRGQDRA
mmetsp:Transcript_39685/g.94934  ORF Transcript_39685/g.94934 Transcript_39685/m.94934 type:complete len:281 (+) Transcript_39685:1271-2113(+)